jgi:hypothetical protein
MKIRPVGAELFRADGRTDRTKLIVALRIFAKVLKNGQKSNFGHRYLYLLYIHYGIITSGTIFIFAF